ncbi:hypothetical protein QL285_029347 [Trifolium repens]|nr:hypothetical protein QL285_029347 [Trifolium repens]
MLQVKNQYKVLFSTMNKIIHKSLISTIANKYKQPQLLTNEPHFQKVSIINFTLNTSLACTLFFTVKDKDPIYINIS